MKDYPVIKFAIPFICGIIINQFYIIHPIFYLALLIIISVLYFLFRIFQTKYADGISILFYAVILLFGSLIALINSGDKSCLSSNIYIAKNLTAFGKIESIDLLHYGYDMPEDNRKKTLTFRFKADSLSAYQFHFKKNIKLLCSVQDESDESLDSLYNSLKPGNYISISGNYYKGRETRKSGRI